MTAVSGGYSLQGSSMQGIDEAKEKHKIVEELFYKIIEYNQWKEYFLEFQKYSFVLGLVSNIGKKFDEDIEVKLKIPKGHICKMNDLPIPGHLIIQSFNDSHLEEILFKCKKEVFFEDYTDYPFKPEISSYIGIPYFKSTDQEYTEQKDIYESRMYRINCYEIYSDKEYDFLVFNIRYLKQNKNMIFPSKLFLNKIPSEIFYEIGSKHFPDVIKGSIEVKEYTELNN